MPNDTAPLLFDQFGGAARKGNVHELTAKGAITLSHLHVIAQHFNWSLRCEKCGSAIQGHNSGNDKYFVIRCSCSEWRCESAGIAGRL